MAYSHLRYDEVSFKASHNSYAITGTLADQLEWNPIRPSDEGCRGLELDICQAPGQWDWAVQHSPIFSPGNDRLRKHLGFLKLWHESHPGHDPVFVTLDVKSASGAYGDFATELDSYIDRFLGSTLLLTPGEVIGGADSLVEAACTTGWPTLGEMEGSFVLCLSGDNSDRKNQYALYRPRERLCFVDRPIPSAGGTGTPSRQRGHSAVFNCELTKGSAWATIVTQLTGGRGFLVRGYGANGLDRWGRALTVGVNAIATDCVVGHAWACVGNEPFAKTV